MYIGETLEKDPVERWKGHQHAFKRGVGCPALRDAVKVHGIENFRFEVLIICFDEDRFKFEREYIKKYNTLVPNGYNILEGGVGGAGFKGKKHSEKTKAKLAEYNRKRLEDPEYRNLLSTRAKGQMEKVKTAGVNWGEKVRNSTKYLKAVEEKRVGCAGRKGGRPSEESKQRLQEEALKLTDKFPIRLHYTI